MIIEMIGDKNDDLLKSFPIIIPDLNQQKNKIKH